MKALASFCRSLGFHVGLHRLKSFIIAFTRFMGAMMLFVVIICYFEANTL